MKDFHPVFSASPQTLVYKTKKDYNNLVPVILSDDKSEVVSYPHPSDVKVGDKFLNPSVLNKDYLLDNRGINKNVAFLKITYEEYALFEDAPSLEFLFNNILDPDPLVELCNCGDKSNYSDPVSQLNSLIESKQLLKKCQTLKPE